MCAASKPVAVVRLRRHLKGFSLVRESGDRAVVARLYGLQRVSDLERLMPAARIFGHDLDMAAALRHVVVRAESLGYHVSVCGDRRREPVLRVWQQQEQQPEVRVRVSLPVGCWAAEKPAWEAYSPGLWARLEAAFGGAGPKVVVACTGTGGLEGRIAFRKGAADVSLAVHPFIRRTGPAMSVCEEADLKQWFDGVLRLGPSGGQVRGSISARRFSTLMRRLGILVDRLCGEVGAVSDLAGAGAAVGAHAGD